MRIVPANHARVRSRAKCFTLIELLVSVAILSIIILIIAAAMNMTRSVWSSSHARVEAYREARATFETMARRISEATLNAFWGYDNPANPKIYTRHSDLHFLSGPGETILGRGVYSGHCVFFQAPFGFAGSEIGTSGMGADVDHMESLLNGWGYYVSYTSDLSERPAFLQSATETHPERFRFRLFEHRIPAEHLKIFEVDSSSALQEPAISSYTDRASINSWINSTGRGYRPAMPVAENILALIISPRAPTIEASGQKEYDIAPNYEYDTRLFQRESSVSQLGKKTRHQLPPVIEITVVATTESSWIRFEDREGTSGATTIAQKVNSLFQDPANYEEDLNELQEFLKDLDLDYRVFTDRIALRAAKWFTDEE